MVGAVRAAYKRRHIPPMKTTFKRNKAGEVSVTFQNMTQGKALALCHALDNYAMTSPVCEDLEISLNNAIQREGKTDADQELFEALAIGKTA